MDKFWNYFLPGFYFTSLGLWWMFSVACAIATLWKSNGTFKTYSWFSVNRCRRTPFEPWCTIVLCALSAIVDLQTGSSDIDDSSGSGTERMGMYSAITFLSIIQLVQFYRSKVPSPYEFLVAAAAFLVIGLELHAHTTEGMPLVISTLQSQIIVVTVLLVVVNVIEFLLRDNPFFGMFRAASLFLFGLTFLHTAFILYPPFSSEPLIIESHHGVSKLEVIFIFEILSVALPTSVILIGVVVDFYDDYL